jgi:hypothetical protein
MPRGMGFRRAIAALLALTLLALPGAPLRHGASAAPHCGTLDAAAPAAHLAAPAYDADHGQPCDDAGHSTPGLACCAAAQCPASLAGPPPASADLPNSLGPSPPFAAPMRSPHGVDVPPVLPPPRGVG